MRKEVAESVRQTSREVTAVQKYLRSSNKPGVVSLAALSSSAASPASRRQTAANTQQQEEIVLENTTIDEENQMKISFKEGLVLLLLSHCVTAVCLLEAGEAADDESAANDTTPTIVYWSF